MRVLPIVALLAFAPPVLASEGAPVAVYRGGAANVPAPIPVYRGSAAAQGHLAASPPATPVGVVGGRRLWFVDPAGDELVACRMAQTFTVGVERIRCVRRRLPTD